MIMLRITIRATTLQAKRKAMVTSSSRFQPNRADRKVSDVFIQHTNLLEERVQFTLCAYCTPGQPSVMVYCACGKKSFWNCALLSESSRN
jgi:hypothetical protein